MIPLRLLLIVFVLGLVVAGAMGMFQSVPIIWNATWQRITQKTPLVQVNAFDTDRMYPSIVEARSEIRPGDDLIITIRGMQYQDIDSPINVIYSVQSNDTAFVKSVSPAQSENLLKTRKGYILSPIDFRVKTNQLANSPSQVIFTITQEVEYEDGSIISDTESLSVTVDNSPFPTDQVVKALLSLAGFLIGVFGTKISIGI